MLIELIKYILAIITIYTTQCYRFRWCTPQAVLSVSDVTYTQTHSAHMRFVVCVARSRCEADVQSVADYFFVYLLVCFFGGFQSWQLTLVGVCVGVLDVYV